LRGVPQIEPKAVNNLLTGYACTGRDLDFPPEKQLVSSGRGIQPVPVGVESVNPLQPCGLRLTVPLDPNLQGRTVGGTNQKTFFS
jgi:hypothetical protein